MILLGGLIRLVLSIFAFWGLAVLIMELVGTDNPLVGYVVGTIGAGLGVIPGVFWANSYTDRKWYG